MGDLAGIFMTAERAFETAFSRDGHEARYRIANRVLALKDLGWPEENRPYRPHLTLARHATEASPPTRSNPMRWRVNRYALVESTGDPSQRYRILHTYWASGIHP